MNRYDEWNEVKKRTQNNKRKLGLKPREIFWANIGQNVGYEQNGKGKNFVRPVIIIRRISKDLFVGIPTTTTIRKDDGYFHSFKYHDKNQNNIDVSALILQIRVFSIKRIMNKIGMVDKENFEKIVEKSKSLIGPT